MRLRAELELDLKEALRGLELLNFCPAAEGDVWVLARGPREHVVLCGATPMLGVPHNPDLPRHWHYAQPLPDAQVLLVSARVRRDEQPNAFRFDAEGALVGSFPVGDGVEDVQNRRDGQIVVSYFDQGAYHFERLAGGGINRFDPEGPLIWSYNHQPASSRVLDCYALNVCGRELWAFTWPDHRVVRCQDGREPVHWTSPVHGAHALAVRGSQVLLHGSYQDRTSATLLNLDRLETRPVEFEGPEGEPLRTDWSQGRGARLYLYLPPRVYSVSLHDLG